MSRARAASSSAPMRLKVEASVAELVVDPSTVTRRVQLAAAEGLRGGGDHGEPAVSGG